MSDDDDHEDEELPDLEPPQPGDADIIKMFVGDISSPTASLNGTSLSRPDAVAIARIAAAGIKSRRGEAALVGSILGELGILLDRLGEEIGETYIENVAFDDAVDLFFVADPKPPDTLRGPESAPRRGAERLASLLRAETPVELLDRLGRNDDAVVKAFERLMKELALAGATMDWQHRPELPPTRMRRERAAQYVQVLEQRDIDPPRTQFFQGILVSAAIDRPEFRIHLSEPWERRQLIEGRYREGLEKRVTTFLGQRVYCEVLITHQRRGARKGEYKFQLEAISRVAELH